MPPAEVVYGSRGVLAMHQRFAACASSAGPIPDLLAHDPSQRPRDEVVVEGPWELEALMGLAVVAARRRQIVADWS
eukprot:2121795-Pyramimonas_sp.AAC.1